MYVLLVFENQMVLKPNKKPKKAHKLTVEHIQREENKAWRNSLLESDGEDGNYINDSVEKPWILFNLDFSRECLGTFLFKLACCNLEEITALIIFICENLNKLIMFGHAWAEVLP